MTTKTDSSVCDFSSNSFRSQILNLQPNDILVLTIERRLPQAERASLYRQLRALVQEEIKIVILDNGMHLRLLRPEIVKMADKSDADDYRSV